MHWRSVCLTTMYVLHTMYTYRVKVEVQNAQVSKILAHIGGISIIRSQWWFFLMYLIDVRGLSNCCLTARHRKISVICARIRVSWKMTINALQQWQTFRKYARESKEHNVMAFDVWTEKLKSHSGVITNNKWICTKHTINKIPWSWIALKI